MFPQQISMDHIFFRIGFHFMIIMSLLSIMCRFALSNSIDVLLFLCCRQIDRLQVYKIRSIILDRLNEALDRCWAWTMSSKWEKSGEKIAGFLYNWNIYTPISAFRFLCPIGIIRFLSVVHDSREKKTQFTRWLWIWLLLVPGVLLDEEKNVFYRLCHSIWELNHSSQRY